MLDSGALSFDLYVQLSCLLFCQEKVTASCVFIFRLGKSHLHNPRGIRCLLEGSQVSCNNQTNVADFKPSQLLSALISA